MPSVNIGEIGTVEFPDSMSESDILRAIESDILPKHNRERLSASPSTQPLLPGQAVPRNRLSESVSGIEPEPPREFGRGLLREPPQPEPAPQIGYLPGRSPEEITRRRESVSEAARLADLMREGEFGRINPESPDAPQRYALANAVRDARIRELGITPIDTSINPYRGVVPFSEAVPPAPAGAGTLRRLGTGAIQGAAGAGEFATSPIGVASMLNPATAAFVVGQMLTDAPEIAQRFDKALAEQDWEGAGREAVNALMIGGIAAKGLKGKKARLSEHLARQIGRNIAESPEWQNAIANIDRTVVNRMAPGTLRPEEIQGGVAAQHEAPPGAVVSPNLAFRNPREQIEIPFPGLPLSQRIRPAIIEEPGAIAPVTRGTVRDDILGGRESFSAASSRLNREGLNRPQEPTPIRPDILSNSTEAESLGLSGASSLSREWQPVGPKLGQLNPVEQIGTDLGLEVRKSGARYNMTIRAQGQPYDGVMLDVPGNATRQVILDKLDQAIGRFQKQVSVPSGQRETPVQAPEKANASTLFAIARDFVERVGQLGDATDSQRVRSKLIRSQLQRTPPHYLGNIASLLNLQYDNATKAWPSMYSHVEPSFGITGGPENAFRKQKPGEEVLGGARSEVELPGVGGGNAGPEIPPAEGGVPVPKPPKAPEGGAGENVLPSLKERADAKLREHGLDPDKLDIPEARLGDVVNSLDKFGKKAADVIAEDYAKKAKAETGPLEKYPETFKTPGTDLNVKDGQIPVEIEGADGKLYGALFNGYWSPEMPSIGRATTGGWSHGLLNKGEKLITKVPTPEEWDARQAAPIAEPVPATEPKPTPAPAPAPVTPAKPSFQEHVAGLKAEQNARLAAAMAKIKPGDVGISFRHPDGRGAVITKSTSEPGKWQLSWFGKDGLPSGHAVFEARDEAIKSAIGITTKSGPPHLDKGFEVFKSQGPQKPAKAAKPAGPRPQYIAPPATPVTTKLSNPAELKQQKTYLLHEVDTAIEESKKEGGPKQIVIKVPGDGIFTLENNTANLRAFRERARKLMPTTVTKESTSAPGRTISGPKSVGVLKKPTTTEETFKAVDDFVSNDEGRAVLGRIYSDGKTLRATNGRILIELDTKVPAGEYSRRDFSKREADEPADSTKKLQDDITKLIADAKAANEPFANGIDTARLVSLANQAKATFVGSERTPSMEFVLNKDGTIGVRSESFEPKDEYSHNVKPGAKSIGLYNASYVEEMGKAARALGHEKVDLNAAKEKSATQPLTVTAPGMFQMLMPMKEGVPEKTAKTVVEKLEAAKIKPSEGGKALSFPHPDAIKAIGAAVWNTAIDIAIASIRAGKTVARAVADAVAFIRTRAAEFDEGKIRDNLAEAIRTGEREPVAAPAASAEAQPAAAAPAAPALPRPTAPNDPLTRVYQHFIPEPKPSVPISERLKNVSESIRTGFSSKFRPLDRMIEDLNKVYGESLKKVSGIFEALKGSSGRSEAQVFRFDRDVSSLVKGHELDFNAYMFLRRSLDRLRQDQRDITAEQERVAAEPVVTEGADLNRERRAESRFEPNRRAVSTYTIPELENLLGLLGERVGPEVIQRFDQAAGRFQDYMNQALRWQVESGRMSQEVYDKIRSENQFYAPFKILKYLNEEARPEGTGFRIDTPAQYTNAMEGIEDPNFKLGDMLSAARMNIRVSRILSDKHAAMQTISRLAPFDIEGRFIRPLVGTMEAGTGQTAVNVYIDGVRRRYSVPSEVAESLQIFQGAGNDLVSAVLSGMAVPFKAGATAWNIPFQVSNILADVPRAALVSKFGIGALRDAYQFPLDYMQSMYASIMGDVIGRPNKLFLDFLESGAAGTTIQESLTPDALRFQQSPRLEGTRDLARSVLMTLPHMAAAIEQTTKVLGVKRAMRATGATSGAELYRMTKDAVTEVRQFSGSPDFGRTGKQVEALRLNLLFMFLNARIQGTVSDLGRLTGRDGSGTAAKTWLKLGTAVGIPTAILYAVNHANPQDADDYEKIPEREKQNYWHIPKSGYITTDSGEKIRDYWRIPKRESAKWIANLMESSLDFAKNRSPEQAGRWFQSLAEDVSPVNIQGRTAQARLESIGASLNPVIKGPIELATGRDMYRHKQMIPDPMRNASPTNQFLVRTPEVYRKLANLMPEVAPEVLRSPIMLDGLVQNLTAGMISQFLPRTGVEGRSGMENFPLLQRFQAAPYTEQREFRQSMDTLQRQAADESLARTRLVDSVLRENKNQPLPVIVRKVVSEGGANPILIERTIDEWIAKQAGITPQEKQILALPAKERADYLRTQLQNANADQKRVLIENWARKRILTEPVAEELVK